MAEHFNVVEQFGIDVFNEETMKQRLPKNVFKALKKTIAEGKELDSSIADVVASAMKDWAIERVDYPDGNYVAYSYDNACR